MAPTFATGDYLIVDEFSYHFRQPKKEEVIVFHYPLSPSTFFIKRVIGVPGSTLEIEGKEIKVGKNEYFVMGDNREASFDSRNWGAVPEKLIVGRAFVRLWPVNKLGLFPGY
ncbi:MAG: signal peptidase I [bacterium]|nr:signal peptidase I [bacterium]